MRQPSISNRPNAISVHGVIVGTGAGTGVGMEVGTGVGIAVGTGVGTEVGAGVGVGGAGATAPIALAAHGGGSPDGVQIASPEGVTDATLVIVDGASADTVAVTVYTSIPPAGNVATVWLIAPLPDALGHTAPLEPAHVQANAVMPVGSGSPIVAPVGAPVPTLPTVTVYTTVPPRCSVLALAVLPMPSWIGSTGVVIAAVHGGLTFPGVQTPSAGVALAVLVTLAGGLAPAVAVTV
jgi:hypothetical protein